MKNNTSIRLEDFCIMDEFNNLLENWTRITGISTRAVDMEGNSISPAFGMAEYCELIRSTKEGRCACRNNMKTNQKGIYECHAGFFDFAIPIETPDGIQLGRVLAGQVLTKEQPVEHVIEKSQKYNLNEDDVRRTVDHTNRRSREEIESIYQLLKQTVDMFVEKSYQKWYDKQQLYDVVSTADIGLWKIVMSKDEKPKLTGSDKMLELLGVEFDGITEEERYREWYSRVTEAAIPSVQASVAVMMRHEKTENIYKWKHPKLGERYIRCGGIGEQTKDGVYVLSGYHSDITDIISNENKQRQLLSDALLEMKHQKGLLQEALDNYKQADYDRRTDFLTGLKNRQDMYEMLSDEMSAIREKVNAAFMIDVDNFKMFNDNFGHVEGDECLKKIGKALIEYEKKNQMLFYRYGGEEILGLSLSPNKQAEDIATDLVQLIYDLGIERNDVPEGRVTISLGYTTDIANASKMIDYADSALYKAKENGKNCAWCYENI